MPSKASYTQIPTSRLVPYEKNSRTHSPDQVNQIQASIKEFGFLNPILVDKKNRVIAGHGRLLAAQKMGLETVPCVMVEHLSDEQRRAYVIADNKIALNSGWDDFVLGQEIEALKLTDIDVSVLGFSDEELNNFDIKEEKLKTNTVKTEELNTTYILLCVPNGLQDKRLDEAMALIEKTACEVIYGSANKKG